MPIIKGVMTKDEELKERNRLKGKGFEAPCYMHAEKRKEIIKKINRQNDIKTKVL